MTTKAKEEETLTVEGALLEVCRVALNQKQVCERQGGKPHEFSFAVTVRLAAWILRLAQYHDEFRMAFTLHTSPLMEKAIASPNTDVIGTLYAIPVRIRDRVAEGQLTMVQNVLLARMDAGSLEWPAVAEKREVFN